MNSFNTIAFIVLAFILGGLLIWKKDTVPVPLRRWMAICSLVFIVFAFFLIVYSAFNLGR
nr:hypothetical protein [Paenibacillus sp. 481]